MYLHGPFFKGEIHPATKYIAIVIHYGLVNILSTSIPTSIESPYTYNITAAISEWVIALAPQAECFVFDSRSRKTSVIKTGSNSSTAKRSAVDETFTGFWR